MGSANARPDDDEKCLCVSRFLFLGYSTASCFNFGDAARVVSWLNALRNSKNVEFAAYDERERAAIRMAPRAAMVKQPISSSASWKVSRAQTTGNVGRRAKAQSEEELVLGRASLG